MKIYAIYHTIRTGSTLLCEYLRGTGLAGNPVDFCSPHAELFIPNCKYQKPMTKEFMETLIKEYSTHNDVFGCKLQYMQYKEFIKDNTLESLFPISPIKIYLTRKDKIKQTISIIKASTSGQWYSFQEARSHPLQYNKSFIEQTMNHFLQQELELQSYFERNNFETLNITYEELIQNPKKVVTNVLDYIGIEYPKDLELINPKVSKQADVINDEWEIKYKRGDKK